MLNVLTNRLNKLTATQSNVSTSNYCSQGHWIKYALFSALKKLQLGQLTIHIGGEQHQFGHEHPNHPHVKLTIKDPQALTTILTRGTLGVAESYMKGDWRTHQLTELCQLFLRNKSALSAVNGRLGWLARYLLKWQHHTNRNTQQGSKRNIAAHYDLSNELFKTFLDPLMMYSSGVYLTSNDTLELASKQKLQRVCEWLGLNETHHVLEIGTGWGSMAIFAAQQTGCRVTTTTISQEQYEHACQKVQQLGLSDKITVLCEDYRDLTGQYDKIISIEMIEAVGKQFLPTFFQQCQRLLANNGQMFLQGITISEQAARHYHNHVDFIQSYIFPGGYLPSNQQIHQLRESETQWQVEKQEDIALDYAQTLDHWREKFELQLKHIRQLGFDEAFIRMWRFYLSYCEAGFREQHIHCMQWLFNKKVA